MFHMEKGKKKVKIPTLKESMSMVKKETVF